MLRAPDSAELDQGEQTESKVAEPNIAICNFYRYSLHLKLGAVIMLRMYIYRWYSVDCDAHKPLAQ